MEATNSSYSVIHGKDQILFISNVPENPENRLSHRNSTETPDNHYLISMIVSQADMNISGCNSFLYRRISWQSLYALSYQMKFCYIATQLLLQGKKKNSYKFYLFYHITHIHLDLSKRDFSLKLSLPPLAAP